MTFGHLQPGGFLKWGCIYYRNPFIDGFSMAKTNHLGDPPLVDKPCGTNCEACDVFCLLSGAFSPLHGFMAPWPPWPPWLRDC